MKLSTKRAIFGIVMFFAISLTIYLCVKYYYRYKNDKTVLKNKYTKEKLKFENSLKDQNNNKKLKILIIQDGAYEKYPEYIKYTKIINELYCKKWNYEYKFIEHKLDEMPPYWLKVYDVNQYLNKNIYDYIMYLDCDAIFYDFNYSIEDIINTIHKHTDRYFDIYIGRDPYFYYALNTGVFIFKNTNSSRKLVRLWLDACIDNENKLTNRCDNWSFENKKWICLNCDWAGVNYEQGVLNQLYELYPDNIALLEETFFSNTYTETKSFIFHAMNRNKQERLTIFKDIYNLITK